MRLGGVGKRAARRAAAGFLPAIVAAFLRRCCLNAQPCVSLRRPRRARGIAISGSALCAFAPSVPCGCTAAALQSRCARPARALLGFSYYPLKRRRSAEGLEAAGRCAFAWRSAVVAKDWVGGVALRSSVALRHSRCVLAPHLAAAAALWQPPAAKEGQGDCDFPLGPPWILLYPLKRRRSAMGLEAAGRCVLTQRSAAVAKGLCVALRSCVALRFCSGVLAPHLAAAAAAWQPPAAKEG